MLNLSLSLVDSPHVLTLTLCWYGFGRDAATSSRSTHPTIARLETVDPLDTSISSEDNSPLFAVAPAAADVLPASMPLALVSTRIAFLPHAQARQRPSERIHVCASARLSPLKTMRALTVHAHARTPNTSRASFACPAAMPYVNR